MGTGSYSASCSGYTASCDQCSSSDVVSNSASYTYWNGSSNVNLCSMISTAIEKCVSQGVPGANQVTTGMVIPIISNEDCSASPNALQCSSSCTDCSTAPNECGIGMVQITPPSSGYIQSLITYGLAPSGTSYCDLVSECNKMGPLWSIEALVIHIGSQLSAGDSLQHAYCTWNGGDGSSCGACEGGIYSECAINAYNSNPNPCGSTSASSNVKVDQLYFYAATSIDFDVAVTIADALGVPGANVTGYYNQAWTWASSKSNLVISVGADSTDALYKNPCGWDSQAAGSTPFVIVGPGPDSANGGVWVDQLPPNNYSDSSPWFINAGGGGYLWETFILTYLLGYYALNGAFPSWFNSSVNIAQHTPGTTCPSGLTTPVSCTNNNATQ